MFVSLLYHKNTQKYIVISKNFYSINLLLSYLLNLWLSPRFISIGQLNTLLYLHLQPINHVVFMESYYLNGMGYLILEWASHLDAFSVYPIQTWLHSYALGRTTVAPSVCPTRSSRTRVSTPQISYACDR